MDNVNNMDRAARVTVNLKLQTTKDLQRVMLELQQKMSYNSTIEYLIELHDIVKRK
jgi:hypothetical protein